MTTGNPSPQLPPLILSGRQSDQPAGKYSAGITQIIKMLESKLEPQLIVAFIANSPIAYDPNPTELIALKELGASPEVVLALQRHGEELRLALARFFWAANPPAAATQIEDEPLPVSDSVGPENSADQGDPGAEVDNRIYGFSGYGYYRPWLWGHARRVHPGPEEHSPHHKKANGASALAPILTETRSAGENAGSSAHPGISPSRNTSHPTPHSRGAPGSAQPGGHSR